jgi:hypothetical protein
MYVKFIVMLVSHSLCMPRQDYTDLYGTECSSLSLNQAVQDSFQMLLVHEKWKMHTVDPMGTPMMLINQLRCL